ncbi:hypothetical protein DYB32_009811 [Aphanomyces invadans]|uniref:Zinc finger ZPR1-type domain-containing protein n=1 Tax=Aphanomyces invadans TaxID=157072 RepID=A0A3R6VQ31_9STRA|nr:hypothetical protein DYB32_009811 [Aphanomyces invadans]
MSSKAPAVLGGTTANKEERVHLDIEDGNEVAAEEESAEMFSNINDDTPNITELQSLCINCHEDGMTKLLLTRIPYFREVILMSFACDHCGFKNSEVQFGGTIQEQGVRMELSVQTREDLNRQLIKSDTAVIEFPEVNFEIPASTQQGTINTIETSRRSSTLLTFVVAGNSHIENLHAPNPDPQLKIETFFRSEAQDLMCGLQPDASHAHDTPSTAPRVLPPRNAGLDTFLAQNNNIAKREVGRAIRFPTQCHSCYKDGESMMCITDIPHFKEVIIMAFNCEHCGFKTNEVKAGGAIPPLGERIVLHVQDQSFLDRDVLKSDSACVHIPEVELEMVAGSLGGLYTTIEGLLDKVCGSIMSTMTESCDGGRSGLRAWLDKLEALKHGTPFTLIIEDPLANSFIYSPCGSAADDPDMTCESYVRTEEENDNLGLLDMKVENYSSEVIDNLSGEALAKVTLSDKQSMARGGQALPESGYHPNPNAVMHLDNPRTTTL